MKCKCIKSSSWYKIDDSLEQTENGGRFEYIINGEYEFEIIKTHATLGAKMLSGSNSIFLKMAETIALTHHEKWDGTGYPHGLKGEDIPLVGRICAIADVFDALSSVRPYKQAWSFEKTFRKLPSHR